MNDGSPASGLPESEGKHARLTFNRMMGLACCSGFVILFFGVETRSAAVIPGMLLLLFGTAYPVVRGNRETTGRATYHRYYSYLFLIALNWCLIMAGMPLEADAWLPLVMTTLGWLAYTACRDPHPVRHGLATVILFGAELTGIVHTVRLFIS